MEALLGSLVAAAILAAVYVVWGRVDEEGPVARTLSRRRWVSAAAGVSVAYVFVDLLPELATQQDAIVKAAGGEELLFPEQRLYALALLSFVVLYGLDHMVLRGREGGGERSREEAGDGVYWLHILGFAAYSALIGYILVERGERGAMSLAAYTFAMALHFFLVGHSLEEEHGETYRRSGRWILAASVLVGWLIGVAVPVSEVTFARLFAILGGGVVITSLRAELPDDRRGRFWPFVSGAVAYAVLLLFA